MTKRRVPLGISLPPKLRDEMRAHPEVNWSAVCREAIRTYLDDLQKPIDYSTAHIRDGTAVWLTDPLRHVCTCTTPKQAEKLIEMLKLKQSGES